MNCLKNRDVFLYNEPLCRNLNLHEIKDYLKEKINVRVEVRKEFISCYFKQEKIEDFARKMAEIRVRDLRRNTFFEPLYGEVKYEERMLKNPKKCSVMYDGFKLQMLLREILPAKEYKHTHIVFTNRLFGTFDENDRRYHARVIICGHPSLISTTGIVEAPAKPKEFYYLKQKSAVLGIPIEVVKEKFKGRFIDYDDERITEVMKGYIMQALMYNITGEPFCNNRNCRLFNAHWQEEVLNAQLNGKDFCVQHEKILEQHRIKKEVFMMTENLRNEIDKLKKEKKAVILAHNYQRPEIQDIADFVGDSLGLAIQASKIDADIIIFCGVDFMAESAKILNPEKIVVHPDRAAKCPMAQMVDVESLQILKNEHKDAAVVSYVNTTADVKAITDICCTSSNAIKVIKSLPDRKIIFVPDTNLGLYIQRFIHDKEFIFWPGCCPTHHKISKDEILELKKKHQNAQIIVHPECAPEVIDIADFVYSTEGMVKHVKKSSSNEFIIGTERELCYRLKKENPDKTFYSLKTAVCPTMKIITMDKVLKSLEVLKPEVILSKEIIEKAKAPLEKMMRIGRGN